MHTISSYIHNFSVQGDQIINYYVLTGSYYCSCEGSGTNAIILDFSYDLLFDTCFVCFFCRRENPELYLEELRAKYKEISEKVEQRKRLKTNGGHVNGNNLSGGVGRGERLNAAQRERMRLLTTAAFDRGKGEDTFGARDEDWQLYKLMSKDNNDEDDEGPDEDEAEFVRLSSRLQVSFTYSLLLISHYSILS